MFDIADRKLGDIIEYSYLDMFLKNNFEYGEKIPIPIPEKNTRKYGITVKEVYFNDNSMWTSKDCNWESFGAMSTLKDYFENDDLLAQYKLQSSDHFKFVPKKTHNLWNCQCGKIHPIEVDKCCGMSYDEQIENIDIATVNEKIYILTEKKYSCAVSLKQEADCEKDSEVKYQEIIGILKSIPNYKNSLQLYKANMIYNYVP